MYLIRIIYILALHEIIVKDSKPTKIHFWIDEKTKEKWQLFANESISGKRNLAKMIKTLVNRHIDNLCETVAESPIDTEEIYTTMRSIADMSTGAVVRSVTESQRSVIERLEDIGEQFNEMRLSFEKEESPTKKRGSKYDF